MHCGHVNQVAGVGVCTGIFDRKGLTGIADAILDNFSDVGQSMNIFSETHFVPREIDYNVQRHNCIDP